MRASPTFSSHSFWKASSYKEKTPDIEKLYTDGGYGSEKNDEKMGIQVTKAISFFMIFSIL